MKLKGSTVEVFTKDSNKRDFYTLEKLIPKLPSSIMELLFKKLPSGSQIEVIDIQ